MTQENYFIMLDSDLVEKLPYKGPVSKRIYLVLPNEKKEEIQEIFVQRFDAFTIDLITSLNRVKKHEAIEIRYSCGQSGFIRIYLGEDGMLAGEFLTNSKQEYDSLKNKLEIKSNF